MGQLIMVRVSMSLVTMWFRFCLRVLKVNAYELC